MGCGASDLSTSASDNSPKRGTWREYKNIDMCFQGDVEIIHNWKMTTSIEKLKRTVENKGYSAVCVGSFGHAALKKFDYQLTKEHCAPSHGYTNTLYIWFPEGADGAQAATKPAVEAKQESKVVSERADGHWETYSNIDMCFQGDAEIIHDWRSNTTLADLKRTVEEKGYSAVCVGSFGHAALKKFDYQLTKKHCAPSRGYTNELHIFFPGADTVKKQVAIATKAQERALAERSLFVMRDADFTGRDDRASKESCASLVEAASLISRKPSAGKYDTCYALRGKQLVTIPAVGAGEMGNGAKWSSGGTLIVCGMDTGHRSKGKMLVALQDVDCCFGDGQVFGGVSSYETALARVKSADNVGVGAYFWHSSSSRLIEKPRNRGANWVGYGGYGWLFLWADEKLEWAGGAKGEDPVGVAAGGVGAGVGVVVEDISPLSLGTTPSRGNPSSTSALNTELNNVARNTDDTMKARALVAAGADLSSTNGWMWRHTPLHQAAYHGRYEMAKTLVDLGSRLDLHSNPCGRGRHGTPLELAKGGGHHRIVKMLEEAAKGAADTLASSVSSAPPQVVIGQPLAAGAVEAVVPTATGKLKAGAAPAGGGSGRPLMEVVTIVKRELGLRDGTVNSILQEAAKALGIDAENKTVVVLAQEVEAHIFGSVQS